MSDFVIDCVSVICPICGKQMKTEGNRIQCTYCAYFDYLPNRNSGGTET